MAVTQRNLRISRTATSDAGETDGIHSAFQFGHTTAHEEVKHRLRSRHSQFNALIYAHSYVAEIFDAETEVQQTQCDIAVEIQHTAQLVEECGSVFGGIVRIIARVERSDGNPFGRIIREIRVLDGI